MIVKQVASVAKEKIKAAGARGVEKQVLLGPQDGVPNFVLRRFTVAPGGCTFYHTHAFEHEVYVLAGRGMIKRESEPIEIEKEMAILVEPNEVHQFINSGNDDLVFLCIIPKHD